MSNLGAFYDWLIQCAQAVLVLGLAPLLSGLTRKIRARLLRRQGPSVLQPYRDLLKLIRKEAVVAENASWLFRAAPYFIFATTWVAAALVPTFATGLPFSAAADLIVIVALLGTARFLLALAGLALHALATLATCLSHAHRALALLFLGQRPSSSAQIGSASSRPAAVSGWCDGW